MSHTLDEQTLIDTYIKPLNLLGLSETPNCLLYNYGLFIDLFQDIFLFEPNEHQLRIFKITKDEFNINREEWSLHEFDYFIKVLFYPLFKKHFPERMNFIVEKIKEGNCYTLSDQFRNMLATVIQGRNKFKGYVEYLQSKQIVMIKYCVGELCYYLELIFRDGKSKTYGSTSDGTKSHETKVIHFHPLEKISSIQCTYSTIPENKQYLGEWISITTNRTKDFCLKGELYKRRGGLRPVSGGRYFSCNIPDEKYLCDLKFEDGGLVGIETK